MSVAGKKLFFLRNPIVGAKVADAFADDVGYAIAAKAGSYRECPGVRVALATKFEQELTGLQPQE